MRILLLGKNGQLGWELQRSLAPLGELVALGRDGGALAADFSRPESLADTVRALRPDVIVNAAAYTAVDRAEEDTTTARTVNAVAPGLLARECRERGALLIHYSTDYVFDGSKAGAYVEEDAVAPLNAYGRTKLEGEQAIARAGGAHLILRTSWVYGPRGGNFLLTRLRAGATREELRVVDDQHGAPTSSLQLARLTRQLLALGRERLDAASGVYHATAAGETTWFGFAEAIFAHRAKRPRLVPIASSDWPTPARRPANSVLSSERLAATFGLRIAPWREGLDEVMAALPAG
jgi:dTDP-4-dehydrorhamnose reductase